MRMMMMMMRFGGICGWKHCITREIILEGVFLEWVLYY